MHGEVYLEITRENVLLKIPQGMKVEVACAPSPGYYVVVLSREVPLFLEEFFIFDGHGEELNELRIQSTLFNRVIGRMVLHTRQLQIGFFPQDMQSKLNIVDKAIIPPTINNEHPRFFKYEVVYC